MGRQMHNTVVIHLGHRFSSIKVGVEEDGGVGNRVGDRLHLQTRKGQS